MTTSALAYVFYSSFLVKWCSGAAHLTIYRNLFHHSNIGAAHRNIISILMHLQNIAVRCTLLINETFILQILAVNCTLNIAARSAFKKFCISYIHNT